MQKQCKLKKAIIVYENIVREYDNALLLKAELEKRKYKVELVFKDTEILFKQRDAIVILPNCYNTEDLKSYLYYLNANGDIFISLQYEQVLSERIEKTGMHNPKGLAKNIYHFCWGENNYRRLLKNGIDNKRLRICGAIQLDFLRHEFDEFYLNKQEIADRYGLNSQKDWLLYISSFSYVNNKVITKYTAKELKDEKFVREFSDISVQSQKATLEWFEKLLINQPNLIIIYRKHPVEADNVLLNKMIEKYPKNFYDIHELSVKQWIKVCDIVTTWFSTSAAEIYMAQKSMYLIRPYHIKKEYDVPFYYNAECIDTCEKLLAVVSQHNEKQEFPISENVIQEYYSITGRPAFKRVADAIDEIAEKNENRIYGPSCYVLRRWKFLFEHGRIFKYLIKTFYLFLYGKFGYKIKNENFRKNYAVNQWEESTRNKQDSLNRIKYNRMREIVNRYL